MNVIIADDQTLFRDMMLSLLGTEADINLTACVGNGADVLKVCASQPVDLVLMDIRMPEMDGIAAARKLQQVSPQTRVILLTAFEERDLSGLAELPNIYGILLKDIHVEHLLQAIQMSRFGLFVTNKSCLRPSAEPDAASGEAGGGMRTAALREGLNPVFTPLDLQILHCLSSGMSNREIAEAINYSEGTVKSRISRLLAEIDLKDRTQLALFALKHHLT
ncbi:MAG: response regulator transcription factor [Clostridiaceae bacterium]|nr:response regulator transcription factor [Clostridiaceae bacterium]